jgi:hypothetical protein
MQISPARMSSVRNPALFDGSITGEAWPRHKLERKNTFFGIAIPTPIYMLPILLEL